MQLNRIGMLAMNNPLRYWLMRHVEWPRFRRLLTEHGFLRQEQNLLDAACGSGRSSVLLSQQLAPGKLHAFDLMPAQLQIAQRLPSSACLICADIKNLPYPHNLFDGIFAFGILHHIADWQRAVVEMQRVLKPGGYIILEEPTRRAVRFFERFAGFEFPPNEQFTWPEFETAFRQQRLKKIAHTKIWLDDFRVYLFQKPD